METRASYILVGAFVIGLMAAGVFFVIRLAATGPGTNLVTLSVIFKDDVTGLSTSADVRYRGVPVGKVKLIDLLEKRDAILVSIEVKPSTPIWSDMIATLETPGLTGAPFVQLKRKPESRKTEAEKKLTPEFYDLTVAAQRRKAVSREIPGGVTDLQAALRSIPETMKEIERTAKEISAFAKAGQKILSENEGEIKKLVVNLRGTLGEAEKLGKSLNKDWPQFVATAKSITGLGNEVRALVRENRRPIADFAATGLYEFSLFLTDTRQFLRTFNRFLLKVESDPSGFLFGNRQKGYEKR